MSILKPTFALFMLLTPNILMADALNQSSSPVGAKVYIVLPTHGETVSSKFKVVFGLKGMGVAPAGMQRKNSGHHHLLIGGKSLPNLNKSLGNDVIHFGAGQTETELTLKPGKHTLQLILGDFIHRPHQKPLVSDEVVVTVKP